MAASKAPLTFGPYYSAQAALTYITMFQQRAFPQDNSASWGSFGLNRAVARSFATRSMIRTVMALR
jgi:hypothetical protein